MDSLSNVFGENSGMWKIAHSLQLVSDNSCCVMNKLGDFLVELLSQQEKDPRKVRSTFLWIFLSYSAAFGRSTYTNVK